MADQALQELGDRLALALAEAVLAHEVHLGQLVLTVQRDHIVQVLTHLRDQPECRFQLLIDLCGVDWPDREQRFEVVYHLLSLTHNRRIRVKLSTDEEGAVPSVTGVFSTAGWFERETWDMYGIYFSDHPDLRRLLTDYGFDGHPLRKDFPLTGYNEVRYDEDQKRVIYEPVKLPQEFRRFEFLSPWEGMTGAVLPGDEKAGGSQGGGTGA